MALKFLNKKGWHTGSLRNIENVWKAEQKHEQEQKKLEELRKQIQEERERDEFRALQEQAGFVGKQERLEFLYDSGLSVGKGSSSSGTGVAFKALEESNNNASASASASTSNKQQPGALFEDKPSSANDSWRKLHSDPLLLIRQREQEALARIKNNPIQMAAIRKSVEGKKEKDKSLDKRERRKKKLSSKSKHSSSKLSDSMVSNDSGEMEKDSTRKSSKDDERNYKSRRHHDEESFDREKRRKTDHRHSKYREESPTSFSYSRGARDDGRKDHNRAQRGKHSSDRLSDTNNDNKKPESSRRSSEVRFDPSREARNDSLYKRRTTAPMLSEEERAARLREMQADAELHEEQRWKRLRKAEDEDAREATNETKLRGNNFLDATQKSVFGADKGGSSTIEESVRRRTYYSQGRSEASDGNAFRR